MAKIKATYAIVLFTKQPKKDGTFPLKLRVTFARKQKYYGIGWDYDQATWEKINNQNARGDYRAIKLKLNEIEKKAKSIIDFFDEGDEEFSFQRFEELFFNLNNSTDFVSEALQNEVDELKEQGRLSSAVAAACALKSFEEFFKNNRIKFKDVTPQSLAKYEDWMLNEQNNSPSTIGIYLRTLRALFNKQIAKGLLEADKYPFGRYKYQIPAVEVRDKVISNEDLRKLFEYKPEYLSNEDRAKDLWFFLYLSNGMNVKDMCRLKYANFNFKEGYFTYARAKTQTTNKQKREIAVIINEHHSEIIKKWGNNFNDMNTYVFPFYSGNVTAGDERRITQNLTGIMNKHMNKIAEKLELDIHITTYSARQTFSNVMLNSDAPIKLISDSLGHSNSLVTEKHYLKRVAIEKQKQFATELLKFDNKSK